MTHETETRGPCRGAPDALEHYANWWRDGGPWLSRADAAALRAEASETPTDVLPHTAEWGTPLDELLDRHHPLGDFLEAAASAGHTGAVGDGLAMTIRASCLFSLAVGEAFLAGHQVDPSDVFAEISVMQRLRDQLDEELAALEAMSARIRATEADPRTELSRQK
jgi:hypothetical protein